MHEPSRRFAAGAAIGATLLAAAAGAARADTPAQLLANYAALAKASPSPERGRQFFTTTHGREWSCATCHGLPPVQPGKHARTARAIAALAPSANAERFTDAAFTEKWFRRNCNDVVGRECTAGEKADVLSWLLALRPGAGTP
jgi:hypothetical protein